jgi:diadenosine tetraphosphate (Ap4A) HIT family hydrolase
VTLDIISKAPYKDYFDLPDNVRADLDSGITLAKELIERSFKPNGYNIGMNCGVAAGQTIFHFHCHLIPRYSGDVNDPRGGVRHAVIGKGYY